MGMGHIKAVYAMWAHLPGKKVQLLIYMAMRLPDEIEEPIWFGTNEELAVALGKDPDDVKSRPESIQREVRRALKDLVDYGALSVARAEAPGRRIEYRLHVSIERWRKSVHRSIDG